MGKGTKDPAAPKKSSSSSSRGSFLGRKPEYAFESADRKLYKVLDKLDHIELSIKLHVMLILCDIVVSIIGLFF